MNSLFIGLGGAGTYALGELQKKFDDYDFASGTVSQNNYLYIDTDLSVQNRYPFINENGDFLQLGQGIVPDNVMDNVYLAANSSRPENIRFKEWIDKDNPSLRANHDFTTGAAGERMLTRIATWSQYTAAIKPTLQRKLTLQGGGTVDRIYIVSGTCGGTGCGSLIDILFLLREIQLANRMITNFPRISLMLVMPQGYIDEFVPDDSRYRNYQLNAYGLLSELNAILKDRWANVSFRKDANGHFLDRNGNVTNNPNNYVEIPNPISGKQWAKHSIRPIAPNLVANLNFEPFDKAYFFDSHNHDAAVAYKYDTVSERIADFVFNLEVGNSVRMNLDSVFSNVLIQSRIDSARDPFVKAFCSTGTFTIQTFEELRKRYVQEKFIYQMIVHGFVGRDTDYPSPQMSDVSLLRDLNDEILEFTQEAWEQISGLYSETDKETLISILNDIKEKSKQKVPSFGTIFPLLGSRSSVSTAFDNLRNKAKGIVYNKCGEWIVRYNLEYAKMQVDYEDRASTRAYSTDIKEIEKLIPKFPKLKSKGSLTEILKTAFTKYVNVLINRFLSDNGYFDECRELLYTITQSINIEEFEIKPKRRLTKWEHWFIKDLIDLQNDPTREFVEPIQNLLSGVGLSGNCDFPKKYEAIIKQTELSTPDMDLPIVNGQIEAQPNTIPWYKEQIIIKINNYINGYSGLFRPDNLKIQYKVIFEQFLNFTRKEAREIVRNFNDALAEPIANKLSDSATLADTAQKLFGAKSTFLSANSDLSLHPLRAIYLGHFTGNQGAGLAQAIIRQPGYVQTEQVIQDDPSNYWSDRYVKIIAKMNYDVSDYAFFSQYKDFFEMYYSGNKDNWSRHMPFSSVTFWECENADIVQLFNKGAEETRIQMLSQSLAWTNVQQFYVFGFMTVLLCKLYDRFKQINGSKDFLNKFQSKKRGRTTIKPLQFDKDAQKITLTFSSDYMHNPHLEKYRVDDNDGVLTISLKQRITDESVANIHDIYNRFVRNWIAIIQKAGQSLSNVNVQPYYRDAFNILFEIANSRGQADILASTISPYYDSQTQTMGDRDFFEEYLLWFSN